MYLDNAWGSYQSLSLDPTGLPKFQFGNCKSRQLCREHPSRHLRVSQPLLGTGAADDPSHFLLASPPSPDRFQEEKSKPSWAPQPPVCGIPLGQSLLPLLVVCQL